MNSARRLGAITTQDIVKSGQFICQVSSNLLQIKDCGLRLPWFELIPKMDIGSGNMVQSCGEF
jgi:hypothetical protein